LQREIQLNESEGFEKYGWWPTKHKPNTKTSLKQKDIVQPNDDEDLGEYASWFWADKSETCEAPESPIRWYEIPTNNPVSTEIRNFIEQVEHWKANGQITNEEAIDIEDALNDLTTQTYLKLLAQQNFINTVPLKAEPWWAIGYNLTGSYTGVVIIETIRTAIRFAHIQHASKKLSFKARQIAAIGGVIPGGGGFPLILLGKHLKKTYPHIFKYFKLYFKGRKFYNILAKQREWDPNPLTKGEAKYLNTLETEEETTPENIVEIERIIFQGLLKEAERPNIPSVNSANNTFDHAKAYGGIC